MTIAYHCLRPTLDDFAEDCMMVTALSALVVRRDTYPASIYQRPPYFYDVPNLNNTQNWDLRIAFLPDTPLNRLCRPPIGLYSRTPTAFLGLARSLSLPVTSASGTGFSIYLLCLF